MDQSTSATPSTLRTILRRGVAIVWWTLTLLLIISAAVSRHNTECLVSTPEQPVTCPNDWIGSTGPFFLLLAAVFLPAPVLFRWVRPARRRLALWLSFLPLIIIFCLVAGWIFVTAITIARTKG